MRFLPLYTILPRHFATGLLYSTILWSPAFSRRSTSLLSLNPFSKKPSLVPNDSKNYRPVSNFSFWSKEKQIVLSQRSIKHFHSKKSFTDTRTHRHLHAYTVYNQLKNRQKQDRQRIRMFTELGHLPVSMGEGGGRRGGGRGG